MEGVAGHTMVRGYPDSDPSTTPMSLHGDPNAGTHVAWAVQAALLARERTGQGQLVELSQSEAVLHHIAYDVLDYEFNGRERGQRGNDHPAFAPYGVFPCAGEDRWIAIACTSDAAFAALLGHLDAAEFAEDERFATTTARLRHRAAVNDLVAERTRRYPAAELARQLQASGVAAAALAHQQEMHTDEHLAARELLQPDHAPGGRHRTCTRGRWASCSTPRMARRSGPRRRWASTTSTCTRRSSACPARSTRSWSTTRSSAPSTSRPPTPKGKTLRH